MTWTKEGLRSLDALTRKQLMLHQAFHINGDVTACMFHESWEDEVSYLLQKLSQVKKEICRPMLRIHQRDIYNLYLLTLAFRVER